MQNAYNNEQQIKNPLIIGVVEDNNDPTFNYRVKVRVADLHPTTISKENLPWAAKLGTSFMGTDMTNDLSHAVPEIGSTVLLLAVENNLNSLLYIGVIHRKTQITPTDTNYLGRYGIYRKDGQFIGIDKIKKLFEILFNGDINIDKITNMTIHASNAINISADNVNVQAKTVNVTGTTTVNGTVTVNGSVSVNNGSVSIANAGNNCFTALPTCLFTGARHSTNQSN